MRQEVEEWLKNHNGSCMCETCKYREQALDSTECQPCPVAWRSHYGEIQYFRPPVHGSGIPEEV